ncbi:hypothetical protein NHX12_022419 [Muraenolepis orangiensis]|uniref:L-fucose mutarotase n=1 Tax=Muraenolepis orangiensis TaxID=630683 RepID=A0A9Q0ENK4_9TELE|nr:hypothetical protein NHX12_022419 [Muraenolepis orangiensis]
MGVLKGVPSILSPDLLYALARMGHGDEIVLADVNFPVSSVCSHGPTEAAVMDLVEADRQRGLNVPVWSTYSHVLLQVGQVQGPLEQVERFAFYQRAKAAFAVVATG